MVACHDKRVEGVLRGCGVQDMNVFEEKKEVEVINLQMDIQGFAY